MSMRRVARRARRVPLREARQRAALDPTGLILELDMAALVRRAGEGLRQHPPDANRRGRPSWWQRLLGKKIS
jgi:hypothetical protein